MLGRMQVFVRVGLLAAAPLVPPLLVQDASLSGRIMWASAYILFLASVFLTARQIRSNPPAAKGISPRYGYSDTQDNSSSLRATTPLGEVLALTFTIGFFGYVFSMSALTYADTNETVAHIADLIAQFGSRTLVFVQTLASGAPQNMTAIEIQKLQAIFTVSIWYFLFTAFVFILNYLFGDSHIFSNSYQFSKSKKWNIPTYVFGVVLGLGWTWGLYFHGPPGQGQTVCWSSSGYSLLVESCFSKDNLSTLFSALIYGLSFVFMPTMVWLSFRKLLTWRQSN